VASGAKETAASPRACLVTFSRVTAAEQVDRLRTWASDRCLNAAAPGIYGREGADTPRAGCRPNEDIGNREETSMGARQKLNSGYFNGALLLAALAGWLGGSWVVFVVALMALLVSSMLAHDIRFRGRGGRS